MRVGISIRFVVAAVALCSCSTLVKDPGAFRMANRTVVGVPGVLHHATKTDGLLVVAERPDSNSRCILSGRSSGEAESVNSNCADSAANGRLFSVKSYDASASYLRFFSEKSFLFWGISATGAWTQQAYDEHRANWSLAEPAAANIEWTDRNVSVGVPIGVSVNNEDKITTVAGIGLRRRVWHKSTFVSDGTDDNVDVSWRDQTMKSFESSQDTIKFQFLGMIGYSF